MKSITVTFLALALAFSVSALAQSNENVTMHDLNKTLELCRSLDHKQIKINCADAAKVCAGSSDKKACLEKQAK